MFLAIGLGIAIATGGITGAIWYLAICALFWFADKGIDAVKAFIKGWKSGRAEQKAQEPLKRRAALRVVNGGRK